MDSCGRHRGSHSHRQLASSAGVSLHVHNGKRNHSHRDSRVTGKAVTGATHEEFLHAVQCARPHHDQLCTVVLCCLLENADGLAFEHAGLPLDPGRD